MSVNASLCRLHGVETYNVEEDDNGGGEVGLKEGADLSGSAQIAVCDWPCTGPELSNEYEDVEDEANPGAEDAWLAAESELVKGVALPLPSGAEANMRETDAAPGEDRGEARKRQHPVESGSLLAGSSEEGEKTNDRGESYGHDWATFAIDVPKNLGRLILIRERGESTCAAIDGGVADGKHGNHDDSVEDRRQTADSGIHNGNDEWRGPGVGGRAADESPVVVWHQKSNKCQGDDVEQCDPPEDLLDGGRKRLPGICGLGRSEANELGSCKSKGSVDED